MIRRFNRFELKYLLPVSKAEALIGDLAGRTEPDEHGGFSGYPIRSLYYDSPDLDFFWDKIEGVKFRRKVRLRVYPSTQPILTGMVEIKQRINKTVQKRRLSLPLEAAYHLCEGNLEHTPADPADARVASEVRYLVQAKHLQPTCMIDYHRRAFVGNEYNPGLRITFDTHLQCRIKGLRVEQTGESRYFLPPDWCILEVKVNETVPDWVSSLLISHNCELNRVSKYCAGVALSKGIQVTHLAVGPSEGVIPDDERAIFPRLTQNLILPPSTAPLEQRHLYGM